MKPEARFWQRLKTSLKGLFLCQGVEFERLENNVGKDMPDLFFEIGQVRGWCELKVVTDLPKKKATKVTCKYTDGQRNWARRHGARAGFVFLMVYIEPNNETLVFDHVHGPELFGKSSYATLKGFCLASCEGIPKPSFIRDVFTRDVRPSTLNREPMHGILRAED